MIRPQDAIVVVDVIVLVDVIVDVLVLVQLVDVVDYPYPSGYGTDIGGTS
ncbi:MAG: hypothetical protein ACR2L2_08705 [Acidobacteriota bacterium]